MDSEAEHKDINKRGFNSGEISFRTCFCRLEQFFEAIIRNYLHSYT